VLQTSRDEVLTRQIIVQENIKYGA
jgi:hypothetical protein